MVTRIEMHIYVGMLLCTLSLLPLYLEQYGWFVLIIGTGIFNFIASIMIFNIEKNFVSASNQEDEK